MSYYQNKDAHKFSKCTHLISRGAIGSSSDKYAKEGIISNPSIIINASSYSPSDVVGVSVNGKRSNRISFDKDLLSKVIASGASIIADSAYDRERPFNIGERELADFLWANGYHAYHSEFGTLWSPLQQSKLVL